MVFTGKMNYFDLESVLVDRFRVGSWYYSDDLQVITAAYYVYFW